MSVHEVNLADPWHLLATGFGSGLSPRAPGTMGTLVAVPLAVPLQFLPYGLHGSVLLLAVVFGIWLCERVARELRLKDPACIVFDEFVGMWIALFMLPAGWYWVVLAFVLFRGFDIVKPWPIGWLDANLPGGHGIMLDDVAAGLMSFAIIQGLALFIGWLA